MIARLGFIQKKVGLSIDEFRRYWLGTHGPLAARIPALRRYEQQHVIEIPERGVFRNRGTDLVDGFSQLWFDDFASMQAALTAETSIVAAEDHAQFIERIRVAVIEQTTVVPVPESRLPMIKRISPLKRRAGLSPEEFRREWQTVHASIITRAPQVKGYVQDLVVSHGDKGGGASYDDLPVDGIVELWFDDATSMHEMFESSIGKEAMSHCSEFIDEITTYVVNPYRIA